MRIVFIMLDTMRYDYLKKGGAKESFAPELDKFADESFFFDNQYIGSFPTVPNREDIMTGKYAFPHRGWGPFPEDGIAAAEILKEAGYVTQLIADTPHLIGSGHGYHRGFDGYHWVRGNECDVYLTRGNYPVKPEMPYEKTRPGKPIFGAPLSDLQFWINPDINCEEDYFAAQTARATSRWIEDNYKLQDFFLWVDIFEIHEPWIPPTYLQERYDPKFNGDFISCYPNYGHSSVYTRAELRNMQALYAGEVSLTSKWVGHILRKLEDVGIYDDCMIAIVSDHGTYLGEHGRTGKFLIDRDTEKILPWPQYDEVNHVPMMMKLPDQKKGARIKEIVQPVDYLPTMLDLAGIKTDIEFDGLSMKPLLKGSKKKWPRKQAYSSNSLRDRYPTYWTSISSSKWLMDIGGGEKDKPVLYDKKSGSGPMKNVASRNPQVVQRMGREYVKFLREKGADEGKVAIMEAKLKL